MEWIQIAFCYINAVSPWNYGKMRICQNELFVFFEYQFIFMLHALKREYNKKLSPAYLKEILYWGAVRR